MERAPGSLQLDLPPGGYKVSFAQAAGGAPQQYFAAVRTAVDQTITLQVGREGSVYANASCVVSSQREVIEAVYDDGFGLNTFEFYCTTKRDRLWGCLQGGGPDCSTVQ